MICLCVQMDAQVYHFYFGENENRRNLFREVRVVADNQDKHGERIATLEQIAENNNGRIKNHAIRIERLEGNNDVLTRLGILMEVQTEMNKQQSAQMEKFGETLDSVNTNLSNLNSTSDQLKNSVGDLGSRITSIENTQNSHKIDVPKLMTKILIGIAMISVGLLSAYLLKVMGLK